MFTYALGEEKLLRDHAFAQFLCSLRGVEMTVFCSTFPHEFIASRRSGGSFLAFLSHIHTVRFSASHGKGPGRSLSGSERVWLGISNDHNFPGKRTLEQA
jgi:hypothetical protein